MGGWGEMTACMRGEGRRKSKKRKKGVEDEERQLNHVLGGTENV